MTTDIKMFDDLSPLPTTGHYVVERSCQVTLVTNKQVDINTAVLDFADASGLLADWAAELYTGYIQSSEAATESNVTADVLESGIVWVIYVAPLYWVQDASTRDYLMRHECVNPFNFDVGTDVVVVKSND